jgi:hypothetical protein
MLTNEADPAPDERQRTGEREASLLGGETGAPPPLTRAAREQAALSSDSAQLA